MYMVNKECDQVSQEFKTVKSLDVWVNDAITHAKRAKHKHLTKYSFLGSLYKQEMSRSILSQLRVNILDFQSYAERYIDLIVPMSDMGEYSGAIGPETKEFFSALRKVSASMNEEFVSGHHIMVALVEDPETKKVFDRFQITKESILQNLPSLDKEITHHHTIPAPSNKPGIDGIEISTEQDPDYPMLSEYGKDLTKLAEEGKLDPIIGRDQEIRQVVQMLSRRNKNNPIIVGEAGVGKSTLVEGLAARIVEKDVPKGIQNKRIISLDMNGLIAGAKMRGEYEERLKKILEEVEKSAGEIILFIDEIHTIVNNGTADAIKPMLARGVLSLIGATTNEEYREHIEKDSALERRFQKIDLVEPSIVESLTILRGIQPKYESYHEVEISDDALVAASTLTDRYVSDRCLPDKAIDAIDEAATKLRMELDSSPDEIDTVQRRLDLLKMEEIAVRKTGNGKRLEKLLERKANAESDLRELRIRWKSEQDIRNRLGALRAEREDLKSQAEVFLKNNDYESASIMNYEDIPAIEQEIQKVEEEAELVLKNPLVSDHVGADEVAAVIASWTGIPVGKMMEGEAEKLVKMEKLLGAKLIGQDKAVESVSDAVRRSRAGVNDPNRPTGSFLFLGPSGTGKTLLAKTLAEFLFDDPNAMVRVDMSEFSEKHSVARLVGAPPGYVGYEAGGQLTEAIRKNPYSVILLDEVEKAHAEVFDILLQVFDDGRLTDGQGNTIDFRNAIIVLTSNLGSSAMIDDSLNDEEKEEYVMDAVRGNFRPEFINRLDEIVIFQSFTKEGLRNIVDLQVAEFANRLKSKNIEFSIDDSARDWLSGNGYEPAYGARPLRRLIQKNIGDKVALMILERRINPGDTAVITAENSELQINVLPAAQEKELSKDSEKETNVSRVESDDKTVDEGEKK